MKKLAGCGLDPQPYARNFHPGRWVKGGFVWTEFPFHLFLGDGKTMPDYMEKGTDSYDVSNEGNIGYQCGSMTITLSLRAKIFNLRRYSA